MLPREARLVLPSWVDEVVGPSRVYRGTEEKMALAIRLSAENVERETGGGPFGADQRWHRFRKLRKVYFCKLYT